MAEDVTYEVEGELLTEGEYFRRTQPPKEGAYEVGATLLSAFAIVIGLSALYLRPFKPGFAAMLLSVIALSVAGERDRLARTAFMIAVLCWLVGGLIAVARNAAVW